MSEEVVRRQSIESTRHGPAERRSASDDVSQDTFICPLCGVQRNEEEIELHTFVVHRCPLCPMRLVTERERDVHIARTHGKIQQLPVVIEENRAFEYRGAFFDIEGWVSPMKTLAFPEHEAALCRWLLPFCLRIVAADYPEAAWHQLPSELTNQAAYVECHFATVTATAEIVRFKRLSGDQPKAAILARALALPNHKPAYAERKLGYVTFDFDGL